MLSFRFSHLESFDQCATAATTTTTVIINIARQPMINMLLFNLYFDGFSLLLAYKSIFAWEFAIENKETLSPLVRSTFFSRFVRCSKNEFDQFSLSTRLSFIGQQKVS